MSWECFNFEQLYTTQEQNKEKYKPLKFLCGMQSKNFYTKVRKISLENTTILKIKSADSYERMCVKQTRPNYSVGSNQDEAEIQYDRLSTLEWCNCEKCEKMSTSLECVCYREIPAVKAFHLKFKTRLSWNTAGSGVFCCGI